MDKRSLPGNCRLSHLYLPLILLSVMAATGCGGGSGGGGNSADGGDDGDSDPSATNAVEISWDRPQQRENGEEILGGNIDHYELAYGTESGDYESFEETTQTSMTVSGLDEGEEYYFAVRVYDASGRVSDFSKEKSRTIR